MNNKRKKLISNLENIDYNYGLLIKEKYKRGAELNFISNTGVVLAKFKNQTELLYDLALSGTSYTSAWMASDKFYSKKFLEHINIPTPKGRIFFINDTKNIIAYANAIGFPMVLKPLTGSHGDYVYSHIDSIAELKDVLKLITNEYLDEDYLLIEKHIEGQEYRLFVTRNNFFAAVNRVPAHIIGDGQHSLGKLIEMENFKRMNPRVNCLCTIKIDDVLKNYLKKKKITLSYKPKNRERVHLRYSSNVCMGGSCIDVTDIAHSSIKKLAFNILEELTGLMCVGIDLICEDIKKPIKTQTYGVCELNCSPGLSLHTAPEIGKFRDAPGALVDLILKKKYEK